MTNNIDTEEDRQKRVEERNPLECMCPECNRPKMNEVRFCIKCYGENCKPEDYYSDDYAYL